MSMHPEKYFSIYGVLMNIKSHVGVVVLRLRDSTTAVKCLAFFLRQM